MTFRISQPPKMSADDYADLARWLNIEACLAFFRCEFDIASMFLDAIDNIHDKLDGME